MDTDGLRLFVLAAEKLNISAAGRELGLAPAVASARLAKLEHTLGADLLHRSTRKVALSLEGSEFLPFAREMLAQEQAARAALGQGQATPTGTLRFTAPSTFAQQYIAPILPEFLAKYPDIMLDLRLSDSRFDLIEGSFDLAIRNAAMEDTSLKGRKLADDVRVLCASPGYLAELGVPECADDLNTHHLIAFANQTPRPLARDDGQIAVFDPRAASGRMTIDDGQCQKLVTMAGAGISINSLWSVHQELRDGSLIRVLPEYVMSDSSKLWLVYPKANVLSAKVRVLIDFLLENIGKNPVWDQE
ncbi:LysR substrate-binding domain-containing protein [Aestuariibius sp. HNIBRBA575]|uniref:LysR family transcriptional regulator n=1 Tax=Aestuariibius sp. HNIBRBA575 TaxID=3233343 RepID=UPI0034A3938F